MVLPPIEKKRFTEGFPPMKICVTGAGGFIASHLAKRLKEEGHTVRGVDWCAPCHGGAHSAAAAIPTSPRTALQEGE